MKNILKNYQEDIVKSTKTSLLIELNSNDLKFFDESIEKNTYFQDENFVFNLSLMMVKDILTNLPSHFLGIKVRFKDGQVGQVQEIV